MLGFLNPIFVERHVTTVLDITPAVRVGILAFSLSLEMLFVFVWVAWKQKVRPIPLVLALVGMHAITYPITLYLSQFIGLNAEVFPFAFEVWLFPKLVSRPVRSTMAPIILGNALSFMAGLLLPGFWVRHFLPFVS